MRNEEEEEMCACTRFLLKSKSPKQTCAFCYNVFVSCVCLYI